MMGCYVKGQGGAMESCAQIIALGCSDTPQLAAG